MMRLGSPDPAAVRVSAERSAEELLGQVAILAEALERSREENAQLRAALRPPEIMFPLEWRLQPMQTDILATLYKRQGKPVGYDALFAVTDCHGSQRAIAVQITQLRKKTGLEILNIGKRAYMLPDASADALRPLIS